MAIPVPTHRRPVEALARGGAVLALGLALALAGAPADGGEPAGACEAALAEPPASDPERRLLQTRCALQRKRYAEAEALVESLATDAAASAEPFLYLGMARFHRGALDAAERALAEADARTEGRAETALYRGLVSLARGEVEAARKALASARALDAERVEPLLSYYEGVAALAAKEHEAGVAALKRVRAKAPGSEWARAAGRRLERLKRARARRSGAPRPSPPSNSPGWIALTAGFEYDDNVILSSGDVPLSDEIANRRDVRGTWELDVGYELLRTKRSSAGLRLRYSGSAHDDLQSFDVDFPQLSLWLGRRLGQNFFGRLRYDYGHAWVDGDSLLDSHSLRGSLFYSWERAGRSRIFARVHGYDHHVGQSDVPDGPGAALAPCASGAQPVCGPAGVDEERARDRDGAGIGIGLLHGLPLERIDSRLSGGYVFHRYWAEGREQSFSGHELRLRWRSELPLGLRLRAGASWLYRPFRHASTVADPDRLVANRQYPVESSDRRDERLRASLGLERSLSEHVRVSLVYRYLENDSNRELFDYRREVVGTYVTLRFGRR